jgi:hypothetical protein
LGEDETVILARDVVLKTGLLDFAVERIGLAAFIEVSEAPAAGDARIRFFQSGVSLIQASIRRRAS